MAKKAPKIVAHRTSKVAKLPPALFRNVCHWLAIGETYDDIHDRLTAMMPEWNEAHPTEALALDDIPSSSSLSRYYQSHEAVRIAEEAERAKLAKDLTAQIVAARDCGDGNEAIMQIVELALLKSSGRVDELPADKLASIHLRNRALDLKEQAQTLNAERLQMEIDRLKFQVEQYRERVAGDNGLELPAPSALFMHVGKKIIGIMLTYGELRPVLKKFERNIATRLGAEAERFEWAEVPRG